MTIKDGELVECTDENIIAEAETMFEAERREEERIERLKAIEELRGFFSNDD